MLGLLRRPQQLLDVLGDLLGFEDDVLRAGQPRVQLPVQRVELVGEVLVLAQLHEPLPLHAAGTNRPRGVSASPVSPRP